MSKVLKSYYSVGNLVMVKPAIFGDPENTIAYVYEEYGEGGISIITQNGRDLGGFSLKEQVDFLQWYGDTGVVYHFRNVIELGNDWRAGVFKPIFDNVERHKIDLNERKARRSDN